LYKADETPSTDLNSDAVIILGISSSLNCWRGDREQPPRHD
jgi:hypothetical protein